jgi:hypothetical protein
MENSLINMHGSPSAHSPETQKSQENNNNKKEKIN